MDITSYVLLNREILRFVGLHPKNGPRSLTFAFLTLLIAVPEAIQIYHSRDIGVILEVSCVLFMLILGILKTIIWTVRGNEINDLITYMFGGYWNMINFEDEAASEFLRYAVFAKAFTKCYIFLAANALFLFYGVFLVQIFGSASETRVFPFLGLYPEGWTESPFYEIVVLSQFLGSFTCVVVIVAIDTLIATAVFHTCGHFKIVQNNLRSLGDYVSHIADTIDDCEESAKESLKILVRQKLRAYIEHHQVVLRFSDTLERLFNPIMLCQVVASIMIICLLGVQLNSPTRTDQGKVLKYLAYLLTTLFQLVLFCLPGEDLINQSLAVSEAAYASNWQKISKLVETDVKFIIFRGQKPANITAGKFTVMCMEHFGTVLSTSMSYFMVLRSL